MAEVFAFRDSTADSAGSDIFTTMKLIQLLGEWGSVGGW